MKKWLLKWIIVMQLFSMGVELLGNLLLNNNETIELTEKQTERETDKFEGDCKDKILFSYTGTYSISFSHTHQYLEYSAILPNIYLQQIELPPEQV
jgi:SET domain-containing protein